MAQARDYDKAFFDNIDATSRTAAERIVPVLLDLVPARSAVDVGGGRGVWLAVLKEHGVEEVLGIDGSYVDLDKLAIRREEFLAADLEKPLQVDRRADLAISLETGEHLPESRAESFVEDLCRLAPVVLFSAAVPRQGGTHHVNEQWQSYWADKFARRGYRPCDAIRRALWHDLDAGVVYLQNALVYASEAALVGNPKLREAVERTDPRLLDVVHPYMFQTVSAFSNDDLVDFWGLLGAIPKVFYRSARRAGGRGLRALGLRKGPGA